MATISNQGFKFLGKQEKTIEGQHLRMDLFQGSDMGAQARLFAQTYYSEGKASWKRLEFFPLNTDQSIGRAEIDLEKAFEEAWNSYTTNPSDHEGVKIAILTDLKNGGNDSIQTAKSEDSLRVDLGGWAPGAIQISLWALKNLGLVMGKEGFVFITRLGQEYLVKHDAVFIGI